MIRRLWAAVRRLWARDRLPDVLEVWSGDPLVRRWSACRLVSVRGGVRDCTRVGEPHPADAGLRCYRLDCRLDDLGRWDVRAFYA